MHWVLYGCMVVFVNAAAADDDDDNTNVNHFSNNIDYDNYVCIFLFNK